MNAEIGIENGVPYLRVTPSTNGEYSLMEYLKPFMPWTEYPDGRGSVQIKGDRLPGSGRPAADSGVASAEAP